LAYKNNATAGAGDVLRYLRAHIKKLTQSMHGLPGAGAALGEGDTSPRGGGSATPAPADYAQLLRGLGEQVRMLRTLDPPT
jgi:hypothetical protein